MFIYQPTTPVWKKNRPMLTNPEIIIMLRMIRAIANFISQILLNYWPGIIKKKLVSCLIYPLNGVLTG